MALFCLPASAQRIFGWCEQGGHRVVTNGLQSSNKVQQSFPACTITVFNGGTVVPATIFSDAGLTTPLANPFTATSTGFWAFFSAPSTYDVQFSGTGITTPFTVAGYTNSGGGGGGGGGSVGPGTVNNLSKFTSTTNVGNATCTDDGVTPMACGLGVSLSTSALFTVKPNNVSTGTTANLLVARDGSATQRVQNAQPTDTNNVIGVAGFGAGTTGSVSIAYSGQFPCTFDNQTAIGDWVTLGSSSRCHDAGATEPAGVENMGRINSINAGAGTLAGVDWGLPDSTNTSAGGGTGVVNNCSNASALAYYSTTGNTVSCPVGATVDGSGNISAPSFTGAGANAGFIVSQQGTVPTLSVANSNYFYGDSTITTTFGTALPSTPGTLGQVLGISSVPDSTHIKTAWGNGVTGAVVNLLSAGAVCNGSNDDTATIQAAYAALTPSFGGTIYWPPPGKVCILSGTVTLANTQGTHIIGGTVIWKGAVANATTSTAAESGNVATLTTASGNWGAAFAVNASIQVSGCSVSGYNGLGQIVSGGSGGTTLTYIAPGNVTGLGAATGCSAGTIPPIFVYDEDISAHTEGFRITSGNVTTNPIGAAFLIKQDSTYSVQSQGNIFTGNLIDGTGVGGLNIGFEIAHGTAANPTNDEHKFYGNNIYNYATAGFTIEFFQSVDIHLDGNTCYAQAAPGAIACVIDTAGAGFDWHGGFMHGNMLADFYGFGQTAHPLTIDSAGSEGSARFAWISQTAGNQTSAPCPVTLINDRFATNALAADGHIVRYQCPGPLNVIGGSYGQFGTPGDFMWAPSATSPIIPYGSIIGVDSSGNTSQGTPLFNVFNTGPPIGNAVMQANNVYTDGSQKAIPPTNPDISYTINPTQVMDPHSGAAILNSFASCETASAPTTLATGATTTDTGLNCLPANSIIDAVVARVTTTITAACTGWELGDAATPARFSSNNVTLTSGTTTDAAHIGTFNNTGIASTTTGIWQAAAAKVRITCAGGNPGAGAIRVIVFYHTPVAPTF